MAIRIQSPDDRAALRQVVSEIRWLLAHSTGVRVDLIRLVRRYEDALYSPPSGDHSDDGRAHPTATPAQILPFPRPRSTGGRLPRADDVSESPA
jgi:hypothetical protein